MDQESIKQIFDENSGSNLFYGGPQKVIELLYNVMFKKDIKLLDISRQIFEYKTKEENKVIKDVKNYKLLQHIRPSYKKCILSYSTSQFENTNTNMNMNEIVNQCVDKHKKAMDDIGNWSNMWTLVIGK
jgi:hypothetical protein